jgi:hypothetical protein
MRWRKLIKEVTKRCTRWEEVGRMLPLLTRLRREERERWMAMGDEVEVLRIRIRGPAPSTRDLRPRDTRILF